MTTSNNSTYYGAGIGGGCFGNGTDITIESGIITAIGGSAGAGIGGGYEGAGTCSGAGVRKERIKGIRKNTSRSPVIGIKVRCTKG